MQNSDGPGRRHLIDGSIIGSPTTTSRAVKIAILPLDQSTHRLAAIRVLADKAASKCVQHCVRAAWRQLEYSAVTKHRTTGRSRTVKVAILSLDERGHRSFSIVGIKVMEGHQCTIWRNLKHCASTTSTNRRSSVQVAIGALNERRSRITSRSTREGESI